ncbi:putative isomerase YbhE [Hypoxylon fragiforme]|uniref:putative isomerase YbhE n=1 Tax=Hypoxylon fragiforme TaxID=63214 RepID=UPI0020C65D18|nr:putative isomerase YbhE [Hypoxylon fragiforme]KAI2612035.1 putative isomerase YbhE [Hypoxylon fragiforme]
MLRKTLTSLLTLGMASAMPSPLNARQDSTPPEPRKLMIGAPYQILAANFTGTEFTITANHTAVGSAPSWLLFRKPGFLYAVDENGNDTSLFSLEIRNHQPDLTSSVKGSSGVVFLEFNADQTRMIGAGYGSGKIDIWDTEEASKNLAYIKSIDIPGTPNPKQGVHHPHQALLDPTGRFFVIPNLGGDTVLVLDTQDGQFNFSGNVTLPPGTGPRHGGFVTVNSAEDACAEPQHYYVLATELTSQLFLFKLAYKDNSISFTQMQVLSTFGHDAPPANATSAAAGELVVAANQRDVYVSNRITGNTTDSIAHFVFKPNNGTGATLDYAETISTGGLRPRMFSLSKDPDQSLVFVANQGGDAGLAAFKRCNVSGTLNPTPVATMPMKSLVAPELAATEFMGPQFVMEI